MNTPTLSKTFALVLTATFALSSAPQAHADLDPALCGLGGAAAGAAVGSQFGGGDGKKAMIILGAIAGAVGGSQLCKQAQPQDVDYARQSERRVIDQGYPNDWSNPRYGGGQNSRSYIEKRGWYGSRECTMTRSVMHDRNGSYMNESVWCTQNGQWVLVSEATVIRQIQWGARGPVAGPSRPMPPRQERLPNWIVSDNRAANFARDVQRAFDSDRKRVVRNYVRDLQRANQFMTLDQLGQVLRAARFDSTRDDILPPLASVVDRRYGSLRTALSAFDSSFSRDRARRILDGSSRGDERRDDRYENRDDRHDGYDRDDRRDDGRREGVPHRRR